MWHQDSHPNVPSDLHQLNDLLAAYVDIHNDVFARSLRRMIPIPGIFQPIDFAGHESDLAFIGEAIEETMRGLQSREEDAEDVRRAFASVQTYSQALRDTVAQLQAICGRLKARAEGHAYAKEEYLADIAAYHRSRDRSYSLGDDMNAAFSFLRVRFARRTPQ